MLKYYSKFARLNQADIKNLLIYYDFEKLRQRENIKFYKIIIFLIEISLKIFRKLYKLFYKEKKKYKKNNFSEIFKFKKNKDNIKFKKNIFDIAVYNIQDFKETNKTLNSVIKIKKKINQYGIKINLNIRYINNSKPGGKIIQNLKKRNIEKINDYKNYAQSEGYTIFLVAGTELKYNEFIYLIFTVLRFSKINFFYFNEKIMNFKKNKNNYFDRPKIYKCSFSRDYLENFNYIGYNFVINRKKINKSLFQFLKDEEPYNFILSSSIDLKKKDYLFINKPLTSINQKVLEANSKYTREKINIIKNYQKKIKIKSTISYNNDKNYLDIMYRLLKPKKITIIIPASGKYFENGKCMLSNLLDGIYNKTNYRNFEVIIIDHSDLDEKQLNYIKKFSNLRRIKLPKLKNLNEFNFSKNCNLGAKKSKSDLLLFLNDDIEIIDKFWIDYMIGHFEKKHVGIVGSKLYYPDYKIQHAGVGFYQNNPAHILINKKDINHFHSNSFMVRNYKSVTGACFMIKKDIFNNVGGFDEHSFKTNYSDTDLCLKAYTYKEGFSVVFEPKSKLIHFASQSRKDSINVPAKVYFEFINRWNLHLDDGYLNSNKFKYQ